MIQWPARCESPCDVCHGRCVHICTLLQHGRISHQREESNICQSASILRHRKQHTVGSAIPYATFTTTLLVLPSAGLATSTPAYLYITMATTRYIVMSVACSITNAFGNSLGSRNSDMNEKNATWPAYANKMLITAKKAGANLGEYVAARLRFGFGSMPNAIIVRKTAPQMEMKDATERYETFFRVRGRVKIQRTTKPTTPQTILQVA